MEQFLISLSHVTDAKSMSFPIGRPRSGCVRTFFPLMCLSWPGWQPELSPSFPPLPEPRQRPVLLTGLKAREV